MKADEKMTDSFEAQIEELDAINENRRAIEEMDDPFGPHIMTYEGGAPDDDIPDDEGPWDQRDVDFLKTMQPEEIRREMDVKRTDAGEVYKGSIENLDLIFSFDPRFAGKIAYNTRREAIVIRDDIDFGIRGIPNVKLDPNRTLLEWRDYHYTACHATAERRYQNGGYGLTALSEKTVASAIDLVARSNAYDPVKDLYDETTWEEGVDEDLVSTLFIRYLGVADNAYSREAARLLLTGMYARTVEPGCDFQHIFILSSRSEGSGKTSFWKTLAGGVDNFKEIGSGGLRDIKTMSEEFRGPSIISFEEMIALTEISYPQANLVLQMSRADTRLSYGLKAELYNFQHVNVATVNGDGFLKTPNPEAGRRYSVFFLSEEFDRHHQVDIEALEKERPKIYAQAKSMYLKMRQERPFGPLKFAYSEEADAQRMEIIQVARETTDDDANLASIIGSVITTPVGQASEEKWKEIVTKHRTDFFIYDGEVYRKDWSRFALLDRAGTIFHENDIVKAELESKGRASKVGLAIAEWAFIKKHSSTREIHGYGNMPAQTVFRIDENKFAKFMDRKRERDDEEALYNLSAGAGYVEQSQKDQEEKIPF